MLFGAWPAGQADQKGQKTMSAPKAREMETVEAEEHNKALESLARVLRCLGRHAFELEKIKIAWNQSVKGVADL